MAQTPPPTLTAPPTAPSRADSANFAARGDAFLGWFATAWDDLVDTLANVYGNAVDAYNSAVAAAASVIAAAAQAANALANAQAAASSAQAAATSAGATLWISGTTYAIGEIRRSPADFRVYGRRTVGAGTTDPSADPTNWAPVAPNGLQLVTVSGTSATIGANTDTAFTNAAACAATVPAIAIGDSFVIRFDNGRLDNTVDLGARSVIGPNGQIRSGVITLNTNPVISLRWWGDYYRSN